MKTFTTKTKFLALLLIPMATLLFAQGTENFEGLPNNQDFFIRDGKTFTSNNTNFDVTTFNGAGAGGSNQFMDNFGSTATNVTYSISTGGPKFTMLTTAFYVSSFADGAMPTNNGTVTVRGYESGVLVTDYTYTKSTGFPIDFNDNNGFFTLNFATDHPTVDLSALNIDRLDITLGGSFQYIAMDDFVFGAEILETDPPFVNAITLNGTPNSTAPSISYTVTFNEAALNVDASDFAIDATGTSGNITSITGSGTSYTVTIGNISGEGTISLDLIAGNNIADALGNSPAPAFTAGDDHFVSRCFQETFESFIDGDIMFSSNGVVFTTGTTNFNVRNFGGAGAGGSDHFLDNNADQGTNKTYTIATSGAEEFTIEAIDIYLSSELNGANPTNDGSITIRGLLGGIQQYAFTKNSGFPTTFGATNGFTVIDFATEDAPDDHSLKNIDVLEISIGGAFSYVALDSYEHCEAVIANNPPIVQSITLVGDPEANTASVDFTVIFNESAINVTEDDFSLDTQGTAMGTISGITGSGNAYTLTVSSISGEGSIRLDLNASTDIEDADGNTPPDPFTDGERHLVSPCDIETFETSAVGAESFTRDGIPFTTGTANFAVEEFIGAGAGSSDRFLSNSTNQVTNATYNIAISNTATIFMNSMEVYVSSTTNGANPTNDGTLVVRGFLDGMELYSFTKSTFPTSNGSTQGFSLVDFTTDGASDFSNTEVDQIQITTGGAFVYVAIDNFKFCEDIVAPIAVCTDYVANVDSNGMTSVAPSDIDGGSTDNASRFFLGLETTSFNSAADNTNQDAIIPGDPFYVNEIQFIVNTTGNYTPSTTNFTGAGAFTLFLIFTEPPVPNSGLFSSRPGYAGGLQLDTNGNFVAGDTANGAAGFLTLQANTTYYMLISDGLALTEHSANINFDAPIITTENKEFDCADAGAYTETLYAFDGNGNVDSCTSAVTINVATTQYTAAGWDNNTPNLGSNAIISADYDSAIEGDIDACACQINNNAITTIKAGNYIRTNGDITVDMGASLIVEHQGSVVQERDDAIVTNNGTINVNITTPDLNPRDFMIMGSPMTAETREGAFGNGFRMLSHDTNAFEPFIDSGGFYGGNFVNFLDADNNDWSVHTGLTTPGEGYLFIPGPDLQTGGSYDLTFASGTLNNGVISYPTIFGDNQNDSPNIIANPYPSAIDALALMQANAAIDELYFWEHETEPSNIYPGGNSANFNMNDISVINSMGASDGTAPLVISSGQGFGIKAATADNVVFNNSMRMTTGNTTLRAPIAANRIWLKVTNEAYQLQSTTLIGFTEDASEGYEPRYDSKALQSAISLYSRIADIPHGFVIQGRETFSNDISIPLGIASNVEENIELELSIEALDGVVWEFNTVYLIDHEMGIQTNLSEGNYSFRSVKGNFENRFTLVFQEDDWLSTPGNDVNSVRLFPNPAENLLHITSSNAPITGITLIDIQGRIILRNQIAETTQHTLDVSKFNIGVYFVTVATSAGNYTKRVLKK